MVYHINMRKLFKLLLLSPLAFSSAGCQKKANPKPVDVIVISGQSNAVGCTRNAKIQESIGSSKYYEWYEGFPDIQIAFDSWTKDGTNFYSQNKSEDDTFMKVMLGQGNSILTFGPEIGIAERMHEKYANKLFLIKYACGASNLKDDWATRDSPMYGRLVDYVKLQMQNLRKMGYTPTIKAFCWMQGEGDSYLGYYDKYQDNLRGFVTNLRADLQEEAGNKDFPFIDAGINDKKSVWEFGKEVNDAKKAFAAESDNNYYIDTKAAGLHTNKEPSESNPDLAHYDSDSQVKLGELFAEAFEPFLMPVEE